MILYIFEAFTHTEVPRTSEDFRGPFRGPSEDFRGLPRTILDALAIKNQQK